MPFAASKDSQLDVLQWVKNAPSDLDQEPESDPDQEPESEVSHKAAAVSALNPPGLPADLFNACLELSTALADFVRRRRPNWTAKQKARYAESHGRLCLWRDNTIDGRLELCLIGSPDLYRSILDLLCALGQTFVKVTNGKLPILYDPVQTFDDLVTPLENLIENGFTVLENLDIGDYTSPSSSETSDIESEAEVGTTNDRIESFLRSIQTRTKLLMDIGPSLEQTYCHANKPTKPLAIGAPVFHVSEAAQHYVRKVYDRFPAGDVRLIERLGEANWQRHQKLRMLDDVSLLPPDEKPREQALPKSIFRPAPTFRDSALGPSLPATSNFAPSLASHTSFISSAASSPGKSRVPKTPSEVSRGKKFECEVCHTILSDIRNRIDWKMHVFADLQPYICTSSDCLNLLDTFPSRKAWAEHEFAKHRSKTAYDCHDCCQSFSVEDEYVQHLVIAHKLNDLRGIQSLALIAAATKTVIDDIAEQKCPLCGTTGWQSQRKFVTHVGRHMEEVALSALPRETESDTDFSNSTLSKSADELSERFSDSDLSKSEVKLSGYLYRGRRSKNPQAHMLTHQSDRPQKCPVKTCDYHKKGFARTFDQNRHTLTHYKGTMVCGFCPDLGIEAEKTFNRADVFKRHLEVVHGVEPITPSRRRRDPANAKLISLTHKPAGNNSEEGRCTTCGGAFTNAQSFYEHLDDCVLRFVTQDEPTPIAEPGIMPPGFQPHHAPNKDGGNQLLQSHILKLLQQQQQHPHQHPFRRWQATVSVSMRATNVFQIVCSLRLIKPDIEITQSISVAIAYEQKVFHESEDKESYDRNHKQKLLDIQETWTRQATNMQQQSRNPQHSMTNLSWRQMQIQGMAPNQNQARLQQGFPNHQLHQSMQASGMGMPQSLTQQRSQFQMANAIMNMQQMPDENEETLFLPPIVPLDSDYKEGVWGAFGSRPKKDKEKKKEEKPPPTPSKSSRVPIDSDYKEDMWGAFEKKKKPIDHTYPLWEPGYRPPPRRELFEQSPPPYTDLDIETLRRGKHFYTGSKEGQVKQPLEEEDDFVLRESLVEESDPTALLSPPQPSPNPFSHLPPTPNPQPPTSNTPSQPAPSPGHPQTPNPTKPPNPQTNKPT